MERWDMTADHMNRANPKSAHYLSMEYLQARDRIALGAVMQASVAIGHYVPFNLRGPPCPRGPARAHVLAPARTHAALYSGRPRIVLGDPGVACESWSSDEVICRPKRRAAPS